MKAEPRWISKKALLLLHEMSLAEFGGERGIRDEGLLDSALARPQNLYAYQTESSVAVLAASYAYGIARNHAFVDGNKRAAFLSIGLFLGVNGYRLAADPMSAVQAIFDLAAGALDERALSVWIEGNMELQGP
ncbi:type II toxin-antitoxin system death-on-curing family toxin [Methylocapsa polymorpha]|uniref:Type II toxin-antitoxin system death-on-curing family toxin n=1 Tax=Methylocapsa polymorpha TaxID=3080828 RepID=A0ABZ0HX12_9HYPH|nr:type II toxin-antitoxin system death-on-curing family toxin [Methylocapsa sp. RX1]